MHHFAELHEQFMRAGHMTRILDESHALIMVLDDERRLVHCTRAVLELAGAEDLQELWGKRPGDFLHCCNAEEAGCGHGFLCGECGALLGILSGLDGAHDETECSLTLRSGDRLQSREFKVRSIPVTLDGKPFVAISLHDWTHEKRCRALEQVFLHDILNTVGAVKGILHFLRSDLVGDNRELLDTILPYFDLCVDEISAQQKLLAAENNELTVSHERFSLGQMLQGLANIHSQHALGRGRDILVEMGSTVDEVISDRTIVHRMCMNLLKNALEATPEGGVVRMRGDVGADGFRVSVHNPGTMPEDVQRHLFRRSYSTKGPGRGLGVYSVHLLCTNYLQGRVWFDSGAAGTSFHLHIPHGQDLQQT